MDWTDDLRRRYAEQGWTAFQPAAARFERMLQQFCVERGIRVVDSNPEGEDWIVLLGDGTEVYVERRSYETGDAQTDFWIGCDAEKGVIAEFFDSRGQVHRQEVIINNKDILSVSETWR